MAYVSRRTRVNFKGTVTSHQEAVAIVNVPGDLAIVSRVVPRSVVMRCPDGCGDVVTVNLDPRTDKAWRLYRTRKGLTLFPSVWRDTGCGSHFILWDDELYWDLFSEERSESDSVLEDRIEAYLKPDAMASYVDIADALQHIPWSVLCACRRLVKQHRAIEGVGELETCFKSTRSSTA
jgi:uncharacterized protein DUF6527